MFDGSYMMVQAETERAVEMPEKFSDRRLGLGN